MRVAKTLPKHVSTIENRDLGLGSAQPPDGRPKSREEVFGGFMQLSLRCFSSFTVFLIFWLIEFACPRSIFSGDDPQLRVPAQAVIIFMW